MITYLYIILLIKQLQRVKCGEFYTVASSVDNELLFWGTRFKQPLDGSTGAARLLQQTTRRQNEAKRHSRQESSTSVSSVASLKDSGGCGSNGVGDNKGNVENEEEDARNNNSGKKVVPVSFLLPLRPLNTSPFFFVYVSFPFVLHLLFTCFIVFGYCSKYVCYLFPQRIQSEIVNFSITGRNILYNN